ncbi:MAG: undecaprenyl/decaprenyl-phosphate alpha-N-acetylglucosaminyl 1-phosphate transferase [Candidatus Magasanikbacteria bacterium]|nr:undecaprenyl/decaprenyl-phosphate alpha-N-acetylglucosaminyl 1-phosphate transferase [Candidatus Magasanikbacteria bacterium]
MSFLFFFGLTLILAVCLTLTVRRIAARHRIFDRPEDTGRKVHQTPVPLLGGLAVCFSFFAVLFFVYFWQPSFFSHLTFKQLGGLFFGSLILMAGGFLDDKYNLKPRYQFIFPLLAAGLILWGGVNLKEITNPWGGKISLAGWGAWSIAVFNLGIFVWLMGLMYTTKLLDGLDGLVTGVAAIGGLMVFLLSTVTKYYQPDIALLALIFVAANLGFLIFNFHPASIFLGEGGSLWAGLMLGFLAIAAGGKIATTLLVVGVAALDVLFVITRRLAGKKSPFSADAGHLHYRLMQAGLSHRQVVLLFYFLSIVFGVLTLILQSAEKLIALLVLLGVVAAIALATEKKGKPSL